MGWEKNARSVSILELVDTVYEIPLDNIFYGWGVETRQHPDGIVLDVEGFRRTIKDALPEKEEEPTK